MNLRLRARLWSACASRAPVRPQWWPLSGGRALAALLLALALAFAVPSYGLVELEFRLGATIGKDGPCAPLYEDTALGYRYAADFLASQAPAAVADASGRQFAVRLRLRVVAHDCTEPGRAAAMQALIDGTQPDPATGAPGEPPVHLVLGGNGINAAGDALQADAADRVLLHCCTARDSVYQLDLPHVYGMFTPASRYTGTVLRTMALRGISRVAVVYTTESLLHVQLCEGAVRQLPLLAELRRGFGSALVLNYTGTQAEAPGFWDATSALVSASGADALVMCDEVTRSSELVQRLHTADHRLAAMWLAGYGNVSDLTANLQGGGEYALTTLQWLPGLPYADGTFGSASDYAGAYRLATGRAATPFSAAASASVYVVRAALQRLVSLCSLEGPAAADADSVLWHEAGLACLIAGSHSELQRMGGQGMLMHVLDMLNMETFFGPVGFNAMRQNVYHPVAVVQVLKGQFAVVLPLDVADAALVMPIPWGVPSKTPWVKTAKGTAITVVLCLLGAFFLALLAAIYRRRALVPRLSVSTAAEIIFADIKVDINPTLNMDGTWEPGEGIYRGARCKLVVATELLPPPPPPPPEKPLRSGPQETAMGGPILEERNSNLLASLRISLCDGLVPVMPLSALQECGVGTAAPQNSTHGRPAGGDAATHAGGALNTLTAADLDLPLQMSLPMPPPLRLPSTNRMAGFSRKTSDGLVQGGTGTPRAPLGGLPQASFASVPSASGFFSTAGPQKADVGFVKRSRRQIAATVWRSVRLQHPNICPVFGIVWEWPGLLEGGASVPVIVRQWYEFDNLSRLLENETVPLPLRTKGSIAQGIAEGLAYLHAQDPPIAASIEASRVIIDRHFNPHLFLRLCNLDPEFASRPPKLRVPSTISWGGQWVTSPAAGTLGRSATSPAPHRGATITPAKLYTSIMIDTCPDHLAGAALPAAADSPGLTSPARHPSLEWDVYEFGALLCQIFLGAAAPESSRGSRFRRMLTAGARGSAGGVDSPFPPGGHADAQGGAGAGLLQLQLLQVAPLVPLPDEEDEQEVALCTLGEICPELGSLARACMQPCATDRPSLAYVVQDLQERVLPALSGNANTSRATHGCGLRRSSIMGELCPRSGVLRDPMRLSADLQPGAAACGHRSSRRSGSFTRTDHRPRGHVLAPDDLLFELFPPKVARALQAGEPVQPERYDCVSIFFSDVVGYTDLCAQLQPGEVMDLVHRLYSQFDALIQAMQLFKVETVGDAYLAVGNLRWPQPSSHARLLAQFALSAVRAANSLLVLPDRPELGHVHIRVGLHCGPVVASVVGAINRRYCLFGDAVNCAARMEHNSEVDRVHCSGAFAALLREQWPEAGLVRRGVIPIKGKGPMETFWVEPLTHGPEGAVCHEELPGLADATLGAMCVGVDHGVRLSAHASSIY